METNRLKKKKKKKKTHTNTKKKKKKKKKKTNLGGGFLGERRTEGEKKIRIPPCAPPLAGIGTTTQLIGHYRGTLNPKWLQVQGGESAGDASNGQALGRTRHCRFQMLVRRRVSKVSTDKTGPGQAARSPFSPENAQMAWPAPGGIASWGSSGQFCPPGWFFCSMHGVLD